MKQLFPPPSWPAEVPAAPAASIPASNFALWWNPRILHPSKDWLPGKPGKCREHILPASNLPFGNVLGVNPVVLQTRVPTR